MTTERITITLQSEVLAYARERAEAEGLSLSAWLNRVADKDKKIVEGLAAMEELWAETGGRTPEGEAWADRMAAAIQSGADQETLNRIWAEYPSEADNDRGMEAA